MVVHRTTFQNTVPLQFEERWLAQEVILLLTEREYLFPSTAEYIGF